jgi:hypothetical protein
MSSPSSALLNGCILLLSSFVPPYITGDVTLLWFGLLEATTFQWWQELSNPPPR